METSENKKTVEEGKNVKDKKENGGQEKPATKKPKKTVDKDDVNADVDQE